MAELTGAEAMVEMMVREGIQYVFGNPGTTELPLMDLFASRDEIAYILALHEDSALGIAAGYAEASGRPAVVNLHTAPGLAHALGNLYNASRAGTPLIVTAGQQDTRAMISEPLLYGDMLQAVRGYTKWAWEVHHAIEIPTAFARAIKIATTPPTGPVFLSLPVNVMEERGEMELPAVTRIVPARTRPDPESVERAARLLVSAANPVIISGDGVARGGAVPEVIKLAETLGARVHTEPLNSLMDFPSGHALAAGPLFPNAKQTHALLAGTDAMVVLGSNMLTPLVYTGDPMIPAGVRLIQMDIDERELGKNFPAEVAIRCDLKPGIEELIRALEPLLGGPVSEAVSTRRQIAIARIAERRAKFAEESIQMADEGPISPAYVARQMREAAAPNAVMVDESVTSTAFVRILFELKEPNSYFYAKGGSLGFGLPEAVGVKLALPDRQVICAIGDGSAMYSIQALWTAARQRLAVTFVVFNNASYMILKGGLMAMQ
ncbi:MAG TPA: thiamine pyrophosphate-binding protein, partial [Blastocatellia bacterium]|nr:thiamine pyrophosphate-binding protein [Blastocatellia bacterium]